MLKGDLFLQLKCNVFAAPNTSQKTASPSSAFHPLGWVCAAFWIRKDYDYILVDCPLLSGMLTDTAIVAADEIMIPVQTEYSAAADMTYPLKTVEKMKFNMKADLK